MANGIRTTNLERQFAIDELLGNVTSDGVEKTARIPLEALAAQLAGSGPFVFGNTVYTLTKAQLDAYTPILPLAGGVVLNDPAPANNGYYARSGGVWVKGRGFPDTFARVTVSGSGTVQTGLVKSGVDPASIEVFFAKVATPNVGPLTLSISGGPVRQVVNLAGNPLAPGEWTGMVMFYLNEASQYQLLVDAGAAAAAAASATLADQRADDAGAQAGLAQSYAALAVAATGRLEFNSIVSLKADTALSYSSGVGLIQVSAGHEVFLQGRRLVVAANGATDHQIATAGGVKLYQGEPTTLIIASDYDVTLADQGRFISVSAVAGSRAVSLPAVASVGNGFRVVAHKSDSSSNVVTIDAAGSELIDGQLAMVLRLKGQSVALTCDGTGWRVMAGAEVFETGTTANGDYLKFANGWMECSLHIPYTGVATTSAAGQIFMSPGISPGNFPRPFISEPSVQYSGKPGNSNGWALCAVKHTSSNWGTYRTAGYASDTDAGGTLSLKATGRWAGASGGIATLVLKNGSADESFIVGRRQSDAIVRGFRGWNATPTFQLGANQYPMLTLTTDVINGVQYRSMSDDMAPYLVKGAHRGGLHSFFGSRLDVFAHGRTNADIGQRIATGGNTYVIIRIMSVNQLFVVRLDSDVAAPTGVYTWVAGGVVTTGFTSSATAWEAWYPMISGRTISLTVDGVPIAETTGLFSYSDEAVFTESYSVMDRADVIAWFIASGAGGGLNITGPALFSVVIRYAFDFEGNLTIEQDFTAKENPTLTINRLYGFQMQQAGATAYYIPKATSSLKTQRRTIMR